MYYTELADAEKVLKMLKRACGSNLDLLTSLNIAFKAYEASLKLDDAGLIGRSLLCMSASHDALGEIDKAIHYLKEAVGYFKILGDDFVLTDAKFRLADIYFRTENFYLSLIYSLECIEAYSRREDYINLSRTQRFLGSIYEYFGDISNAIMAYEKSIAAAKKRSDRDLEADVYNQLSGVYLNLNELEKAEELVEKAFLFKQVSGDKKGLAFSLYGKGKVYTRKKQLHRAKDAFNESIRLHREIGEFFGLGMCYFKLGVLHYEMGQTDEAITALKGAHNFAGMYNLTIVKSKCNNLLYKLFKQKGDLQNALFYIEEFLHDREEILGGQTQKVIDSYSAITAMERMKWDAETQREKADMLEKKRKAEQASKMKQDFLSTMSHEIRTPLNAVTTITSLLEDNPRVDQVGLIKSLSFSSNNLLRIINDILDFNKLDVGKLQLRFAPVDFRALIENIKMTYGNLADEKGIDFDLEIDEDVAEYYALDETRITQILGNLLSNAIKFTNRGRVKLKVEITAEGDNTDQLKFSVIDSGIGISPEFLPEIFDSFTQPKDHRSKIYGGSGLGLAIVKKLLELHHAEMEVSSEVGVGSIFSFTLDLAHAETLAMQAEAAMKQLMDKKVLIAEDNMVNAMVSIRLLNKWGLRSVHASNGEEAVQIAESQVFDCILMDIHMPTMDGIKAAELIRNTENPNAKTPIYALTADVMVGNEKEIEGLFNGVLLKPIEQDKLYSVLAS